MLCTAIVVLSLWFLPDPGMQPAYATASRSEAVVGSGGMGTAAIFAVTGGGAPLDSGPSSRAQSSSEEPEIQWRKPDGAAHFEEGKKKFEAGDFRAAFKSFKSAYKLAKGKRSKVLVASWRKGAEGGVFLDQLKKSIPTRGKRRTLQNAEKKLEQYAGTPISSRFGTFVEELARQVYTVIEDFEIKSGRFTEKLGKTFIDDPKYVKHGKRAIRWKTTGRDAELKVKKLPRNLSGYEAVAMWVCFPNKGPGYELIFKGVGKTKRQAGGVATNAFFKQVKGHRGWKRIEVPLKSFLGQGTVTWSKIQDFRIQFKGTRNITLYVDHIVLVKKDSPLPK